MINKLFSFFIKPYISDSNEEKYIEMVILTSLLSIAAIIMGALSLLVLLVIAEDQPVANHIKPIGISAIIFFLCYLISRTRYYKIAGFIGCASLWLATLSASISDPRHIVIAESLPYVALMITIAGLTLGQRYAVIFGVLGSCSILLLPFINHDIKYNFIMSSFVFISGLSVLIILFSNLLKNKMNALIKSESHLKQVQSQLIQSEKLAGIGQLAAGIAHEINNPIGFISSNYSSLKKYFNVMQNALKMYQSAEIREEINKKAKEMDIDFIIEDIEILLNENFEGLSRVINIVNNLKDFSRITSTENLIQMDMNEALKNTLAIVRNEIKFIADVDTDYGDVSLIPGNPGEINQVLLNILINASQAIKENKDKKGKLSIKTYEDADFVFCNIVDNGPGIPKDVMPNIFNPFFTTKEVGQGTGLGLNISYNIVANKHKGDILVESEKGQGAKFTIKLPKKADKE